MYLGPLVLGVLCIICYLLEPQASEWLAYKRHLFSEQPWRLLTANLVHSNFHHFLINLGGLILIWALHGDYYRTRSFLLLSCLIGLGVTVGQHNISPQLTGYVGLSGVLYGLFAWGTIQDIRHKRLSGWLLLLGLAIKIGHEQTVGPNPDVEAMIEANVAVNSHLCGVITALAVALGQWLWQHNHSTSHLE